MCFHTFIFVFVCRSTGFPLFAGCPVMMMVVMMVASALNSFIMTIPFIMMVAICAACFFSLHPRRRVLHCVLGCGADCGDRSRAART